MTPEGPSMEHAARQLAQTNAIRKQTKNYVPAFLASVLISKNPSHYGFEVVPEPALAFCLTADPALITARKNELTVAETTRQIECYRGLTRWVRNFAELPADGDRVKVVDRMSADVLALYAGHRAPERI